MDGADVLVGLAAVAVTYVLYKAAPYLHSFASESNSAYMDDD